MITTFDDLGKTAVFIDGPNLFAATRALDFDIDYRSLLGIFTRNPYFIRAYYYSAIIDSEEFTPLRPLVDWLTYNGYTLVSKTAKEYTDTSGRRRIKGNMDVEMTVDMLELSDKLDHIILFSGDGDFCKLIEAVQRKGVRVTVISTIKSQPSMIADELRRQADAFVDIADIMDQFTRK